MAARELNQVVDEDELNPERPQVNWNPSTWDWDYWCSYQTPKMVRIKDAPLGMLYWGIVTLVIMYMIIVAFHMDGKHTRQGTGVGTVITKFQGKGFAGDKIFDGPDLRFPIIEPSGAFLMTRRIVVKDQKMGSCVDMDSPRMCPCLDGGACNGTHCEVRGWCPSLGDANVDSPPDGAIEEIITGLEEGFLKISSAIAFPSIGNRFFVTGSSPGAHNMFEKIRIKDLLAKTHPPVELKDLPNGALIGVSFFWNCDVGYYGTSPCEPHVVIKRLDGGQGFVQKRVHHKRTGGEDTRDAVYMYGLRILVDSSGLGKRVSLELIVIQIGSALALLKTASMAADFLMLRCFQAEKIKAYSACKYEQTKDYSDLQDRLDLIDAEMKKTEKTPGPQGSGSRVRMGLGAGGRGGTAANVLAGGARSRRL